MHAQLVQQLQGRPDENAPGDGHCDTVLAVDAHPKMSVIASGALEKDKTVRASSSCSLHTCSTKLGHALSAKPLSKLWGFVRLCCDHLGLSKTHSNASAADACEVE
jgi:hypothetical protein